MKLFFIFLMLFSSYIPTNILQCDFKTIGSGIRGSIQFKTGGINVGITNKETSFYVSSAKVSYPEKLLDGDEMKSSNSVSVLDYVKIIEGKEAEAYHFYENNWAEFRRYALANGFITGFRMMRTESDEYDLILETRYADSTQLNAIEQHFKTWYEGNPSPDLLNELKPNDFRLNVKNETVYLHERMTNLNSQNQNCNSENHRAFDFWLGDWEVYNKKGDHIGSNNIHLIQNGCGIQENWTSKGGGTGTSYNFYDSKTEKWYQSWISNSGNALLLSGGYHDGKMEMQSQLIEGKIDRIKWIPQKDSSVLQIWEISTDKGETWQEIFWGRYIKNEG